MRLAFRTAVRSLRTRPGYAIAVIVTFGLASAVGGALVLMARALSPSLPGVPDPAAVQAIRFVDAVNAPVVGATGASPEFASACRDCGAVFGFAPFRPLVSAGAAPRPVVGELVTSRYFDGLGVGAARGSLGWEASADAAPGLPVAVISQRLWSRLFGDSRDMSGAVLDIDGSPFVVVGVAPPAFRGLWAPEVLPTDVWVPVGSTALAQARPRADGRLPALTWHVRLGSDRPVREQLLAGARVAWPEAGVSDVRLAPASVAPEGAPGPRGHFRAASRVLVAAAAALVVTLLVGLGALLLARLRERAHEFAVRVALGASAMAAVGAATSELVLLAVAGTCVGMPLAFAVPALVRRHGEVAAKGLEITAPVVDLAGVVAPVVVCALLLGLALAVLWGGLRRLDLERVLRREAPAGAIARGSRLYAERALLAVQALTCVATMLLGITAALMVREAGSVPAFERLGDLTAISVQWRDEGTPDDAAALRAHVRTVAATLGVAVGLSDRIPFDRGGAAPVEATLLSDGIERTSVRLLRSRVNHDYVRLLSVRPVAGRVLDDGDATSGAHVVMLNESAVKRLGLTPSQALGRAVRLLDGGPAGAVVDALVVGVFPDGVDGQSGPAAFAPFTTVPPVAFAILPGSAPPARIQEARRILASRATPALRVLDVRTFRDVLRHTLAPWQVIALWSVGLAVLGMCVSGTALTGLLQFSARQRHRELAVRLTMGMSRGQLYRTTLALGAVPLLVGVASGLGLGSAVARAASHRVPLEAHLVAVAAVLAIATVAAIPTVVSLRRELDSGAVATVLKGG